MTTETRYKYIHFVRTGEAFGHPAYSCRNNRSDDTLGIVEWYPAWRQYVWGGSLMPRSWPIEEWPDPIGPDLDAARFTIPGEPLSKLRARTVVKDGKVRTYTPAATKAAEKVIQGYYVAGWREFFDDDVRYGVRIFFYRKSRVHRDIDNMAKLVLDALNKMVWQDDTQIDELIVRRSEDRANPRTEVLVYKIECDGAA